MSRWFRAYDDALHDPKVQSLPPALFKFWFNLLCVASKNGGFIPPLDELKTVLKARLDHVETYVKDLLKRGLLDEVDGRIEPHNWQKRQYKSDLSTPRVRTHRETKRNVSETPPDNRVQNTDTEQSSSVAKATGASAPASGEVVEADLYRFGRSLLGKSCGGVITALRVHCRQDFRAVMDLLEQSRDKAAPMEWLQGVLRGTESARLAHHQIFPKEIYQNVL